MLCIVYTKEGNDLLYVLEKEPVPCLLICYCRKRKKGGRRKEGRKKKKERKEEEEERRRKERK